MNRKTTPYPASHSGIIRRLLILAVMLAALEIISARPVCICADGEIAEFFELPFSSEWTSGQTTSRTNVHYYKINITRPGLLMLEIMNMTSGQAFFLTDEEKNSLDQIIAGKEYIWGASEENPYHGSGFWYLEKGIYYIKIYPWEYGDGYGKYKLKVSFKDAGSSEREPNDEASQAMPLTFGEEIKGMTSLQSKTDWFRFTVDQTETVTLVLRTWFSPVGWELLRSDLTKIDGGTDTGGELRQENTHYITKKLDAGDYYFRIETIDADYTMYGFYNLMVFRPILDITLECPEMIFVGEDPVPVHAVVTPSNATFQNLKWSSSNLLAAGVSDQGVITPRANASAPVTITAKSADSTDITASVKVYVRTPKLELEKESFTLKVGETAQINITRLVPEGDVEFTSGSPEVAAVDKSGTITAAGSGKCQITVRHRKLSRIVNVTVERRAQNIKGLKSSYTVAKGHDPFLLNARTTGDGTLTYKSSSRKVAKVNSDGRVTPLRIGSATITVKASQTTMYAGTARKISLTVRPPKVSFISVKNLRGRKVRLTWKRVSGISGYEIEYSTNARFKARIKSLDIGSSGTTEYTLTKLTKGARYYVRIRAYKDASDGKIYNSAWTKKSVKIKR